MKTMGAIFLILVCTLVGYRLCYPARIIDIHRTSENSITLVVEYFPWTKTGKIRWWERQRDGIFKQLNFNERLYSVYIYNTRYKKDSGTDQDSDLFCFEDMATQENCVSKENRPLIIHHYRDGHTEYITESILRRLY